MKYKVFQNNTLKAARLLPNMNNWTALEEYPGVTAYLDCQTFGVEKYKSEYAKYYDKVALVEAGDPEEVFRITNIPCEENRKNVEVYDTMRSLSVGDIIVDENGEAQIVDIVGFSKVDFESVLEIGSLNNLI